MAKNDFVPQSGKLKLEVLSKLPSRNYRRVHTKTFRIIDSSRGLEFILYQTAKGSLRVCGIVESDVMEKVWDITRKIFPRTTREGEKTVSYYMEHSDVAYSFFALILEQVRNGRSWYKDAHHGSGNHYYHVICNGIFLAIPVHTLFHRKAAISANQGYDAFISSLEDINDPDLLEYYTNDRREVLFRHMEENQMQEEVIRYFFHNIRNFDKCCKILLEKSEAQTEREISFEITL